MDDLKALVAKWRAGLDDDVHSKDSWHQGLAYGKSDCADELEAALSRSVGGELLERYACNGPQGTFWTDDAELANKLIAATFDRDEWTVTDTQNPYGAAAPTPHGGEDAWTDEMAWAFRKAVDNPHAQWHAWPDRFRGGIAAAIAASREVGNGRE